MLYKEQVNHLFKNRCAVDPLELLHDFGTRDQMKLPQVLLLILALALTLGACNKRSLPTAEAFRAFYGACKDKNLIGYKNSLSRSALKSYEMEASASSRSQTLDDVLKHYLDSNQGYLVDSSSGKAKLTHVNAGISEVLRRTNIGLPEAPPNVRNETITGEMATLEIQNEAGTWDTSFFYREDGAWKMGLSPAISGEIDTPQGPPKDMLVNLVTYTDEDCAKLADKRSLTFEEAQRYSTCMKVDDAIRTGDTGKYELRGYPAGWYRLIYRWSLPLNPTLDPGTADLDTFPRGPDLEGAVLTNYGRNKETPNRVSLRITGKVFYFSGSAPMTRNITYAGAPYKSR